MHSLVPSPTRRNPDSGRQPARELVVGEQHEGQRIDNFLLARLKGVPRTRIYRILRRGEVRVNKGRIRQHYRLREGDVVRLPPLRAGARAPSAAPAGGLLRRIESSIIHEDRGLVVLDKPTGVAVHGGSGRSHGLIEALRAARPAEPFLELAHRLDRDTSGCLLVAKRRAALRALHEAFRRGGVDKDYLVLVKGRWTGPARTVAAGLRKNTVRSGERVVRLDEQGKAARTRFSPLAVGERASLLRARPLTGRTHQIRVHAAAIGHPVAGDEKYGERGFNAEMRELGLRRLFLHAARIRLPHPSSGEALDVEAPLPEELATVLAGLGLSPGTGARERDTRP